MTLTPYTPTTKQIRDCFVKGAPKFMDSRTEHEGEFDRWLEDIRNAVLVQHPIMSMPARSYGDRDASGCPVCRTYGPCPTRTAITEATALEPRDNG